MDAPKYDLKKIIIAGIILVIIAGLIGFLIIRKKNNNTDEPATPNDLFPYGTTTNTDNPDGAGPIDSTNPPGTDGPAGGQITMASANDLRQITNYPVTNMIATLFNKTVSEPKLDEKTGRTIFISRIVPTNMIRWNIKQTGILMDAEVSDQSIVQSQLTVTQIPAAAELWFGKSGNAMVYRTWNDTDRTIASYRGALPVPPVLDYCTLPFSQETKQGGKTNEAKELQKYLNVKLKIALVTDGAFGIKSVAALKQLQTTLNLPQSGKTDTETLSAINADCATIRAAFESAQAEPKKLVGAFMVPNILRGTVSSDGSQFFYLTADQTGASGLTVNADGTGAKKVFTSPFTEWMPQWVDAGTIAMTTMASREADGYLYYLNPANGNSKKILGPVRGLTTLVSPDGKTVLYSNSTDTGFATRLYNAVTGAVRTLDLTTLPAKCAWRDTVTVICGIPQTIPNNQYPDAWYQGLVLFGDAIWSINTQTGATDLIITPEQKMDAVKLQVSPDKNYLYFINRNDETLWSLKLN